MLEIILLIIASCQLKTVNSITGNKIRFSRYPDLENRNSSFFILSTSRESSHIKCAASCTNWTGCESFFFNIGTGECQLHDALFITSEETFVQFDVLYYYVIKGETDWCPGWKKFEAMDNGPCVQFQNKSKTWHDARSICEAGTLYTSLVIVDNANKQGKVSTQAVNNGFDGNLFIGLAEVEDDKYKWVDGTKTGYTHWHPNDDSKPGVADCVHMENSGGWWLRADCSLKRSFICEMLPDKNQYMEMMNIAK